jgi:hypothetical protein
MLVMLPLAAVAQKSFTTGSTKPTKPDAPVYVSISVTGAPGDGNTSLKEAARVELEAKGAVERPGASAYKIRCTVSVVDTRDANGKQPIHIEWDVKDPQGKRLGYFSQRNEVKPEEIHGPWGETAEHAAAAAVLGIIKLLRPQYVEDDAIPRK